MNPRNTRLTHPYPPTPSSPGDAAAVAAYRDQRRRLQKEAVLGRGELIESVLRGRRAALAGLRETPWLRRLIDTTYRQVGR